MPESFFEVAELPELQKSDNGVAFPIVLFPNRKVDNAGHELSSLMEAIEANKPWLESLLHKSGAVLFRGFNVTTSSEFNDVVEAFGYPDMPYIGGGGLRTQVVGRVFTANEAPPDQRIQFHHEMTYASNFPTKLFFFCEVEPGKGGETSIVLSHVIYERMNDKYPEFVERLEEHGLAYARLMGDEDDHLNSNGRSWKSTFSTNDKSIAEERAAKQGMKLEWIEKGVIVKTPAVSAIRFDETRQRKTWFNRLAVAYVSSQRNAKNYDPDKFITFGDGRTLPANVAHDCLKIMDEESVVLPWQKGDILLVDNLAVLHSRMPLIEPPRRILAALCK